MEQGLNQGLIATIQLHDTALSTAQATELDLLTYLPTALLFELERNAGNEHLFKLNSQF